ncbi:hypothetical protein, partial [Streptomyces sp. NPDC050704]|uniref:hypothetical protein n=1 Tax=Streptomyces sp. NPDC050704 TaxID=3157219 RepID=UPI0034407966
MVALATPAHATSALPAPNVDAIRAVQEQAVAHGAPGGGRVGTASVVGAPNATTPHGWRSSAATSMKAEA